MIMSENKYDYMPISEIHTPREQCSQIAKRNAKSCLEKIKDDCEYYGIDLGCCIRIFKQEISKMYKYYDGD